MFLDAIIRVLAMSLVAFGLAWPIAQRMVLDPPEKVVVSVTLSLVGVFLTAWLVYVCFLPLTILWALPLSAAFNLVWQRHRLVAILRDSAARQIVVGQLIVTAWCIGCLALITNYSGGGWTGDWFGHWQRTEFFLDHGPRDVLFNGFDPITSRPPLANIITGAFLVLTSRDFAHYQLASTVLSSFAFLPAALLARRFGGVRSIAVLVVLFMANPMLVQNATFSWTKLPAAFFALLGLYFFLRLLAEPPRLLHAFFCGAGLACGILAHYSIGPYVVVLAGAWVAVSWSRRHDPAWWRATAIVAGTGALILALWFGWSLAVFGTQGTLLTNTSVTDRAPSAAAQVVRVLLNVRDTLVPHFLRPGNFADFAQPSRLGWWRDWFFQIYQVNVFFACGSIGCAAIVVALAARARTATPAERFFWGSFIGLTIFLGIVVHGARDTWGLAHICLQPLVILALAFLAARWDRLSRRWKIATTAGVVVDFALGVVLQLSAESGALEHRFLTPRDGRITFPYYSEYSAMNFRAKWQSGWKFFGDGFVSYEPIIAILLVALLALAVRRACQSETSKSTTTTPPLPEVVS